VTQVTAEGTPLDEAAFRKLWKHARPLSPEDPILNSWHYAPWAIVKFTTDTGLYELELFLGGIGFLEIPGGASGAVACFGP